MKGGNTLLGRTYGGNRFCSSLVEFASLLGGRAGVSSVVVSSVDLHFFVKCSTFTQGPDAPRIYALDNIVGTYYRGPGAGALMRGF